MRLTAEAASRVYSDRACTPDETMARVQPLLRSFGITRLARLTSLDRIGIPVWNAVAPNARSIVINQGKGLTDIDAKVSAAMEALERTVAGEPCLEWTMSSCKALSNAGHRWEALPSLIGSGQQDVTLDDELRWAEGTDLNSGEPVFIPYEAVLLDRTMASRFWQSSDGLASGNTAEEAQLHALLERVERDAYVLWQVAQDSTASAADPASFRDPLVDALTAKIEAAGLTLRLFDITSDIELPVYSAFIASGDIRAARFVRFADVAQGCGAHVDPVRAALRAITEAAQSRLTYISGARDDISPESFTRPLPSSIRRLFDLPVAPLPAAAPPHLPSGASALLRLVLDRLHAARITSPITVGLADPLLPFHVAKVFVPELENPEGKRKRLLGARAISRSLEIV